MRFAAALALVLLLSGCQILSFLGAASTPMPMDCIPGSQTRPC